MTSPKKRRPLFAPAAIEAMLRERMRKRRVNRLFDTMEKLSSLTPPSPRLKLLLRFKLRGPNDAIWMRVIADTNIKDMFG